MMDFSTDKFEWSHGKKPRGYGLWLFMVSALGKGRSEVFEFHGSYGDAKRAAVKHARSFKAEWTLVEVMP